MVAMKEEEEEDGKERRETRMTLPIPLNPRDTPLSILSFSLSPPQKKKKKKKFHRKKKVNFFFLSFYSLSFSFSSSVQKKIFSEKFK